MHEEKSDFVVIGVVLLLNSIICMKYTQTELPLDIPLLTSLGFVILVKVDGE